MTSPNSLDDNRRTVEGYEEYASVYANAVAQIPSGLGAEGLRRLAAMAGAGAHILELGSGPGWDADYVESLGPSVRRTDVAHAFCALQVERGKQCELLDALTDELGGPYDGVLALCVLQHFGRDLIDPLLGRIVAALRPGGALLVSIREGEGDVWEKGNSGRDYFTALWGLDDFVGHLSDAGLSLIWQARTHETEGDWLTLLAQRD